jgi:hypothetical protein
MKRGGEPLTLPCLLHAYTGSANTTVAVEPAPAAVFIRGEALNTIAASSSNALAHLTGTAT